MARRCFGLLCAGLLAACSRASAPEGPRPPALPLLAGSLDDFLRVELPRGAQPQGDFAGPHPDCEASRVRSFALGGGVYRLVEGRMARTASAAEFPLLIKRVILAAEDDLSAAHPKFTKLSMAAPDMLGMLAAGSLTIEDRGELLVGIAYLRLPGGEIFSLELFQRGQADAGVPPTSVLEEIAAAAQPGPRAPSVGPGVFQLLRPPASGRARSLQISLPAAHLVQCHPGPDFDVYDVRRVQPLDAAAEGHLFFYVGGFPQPQKAETSADRPDWAKGFREKGQLMGKPIAWRLLQPDGVIGSPHLGAVAPLGDELKADLRVVCSSAEECARLQGIAESLGAP